jgi:uncharacterized phage protein (TIGR02220 family)
MKYFLHDTAAFQDEKITELYMNFGYEGIGLYFTLLEKIALQEKPVKTSVLKKQLNVGKRLNKCWTFMESLGIISSNNGETFSKTLLNFSEKYQIKKEKTRKRVSEWRKKQDDIKDVTSYKHVRNSHKVKESKVKVNKDKEIHPFIELFNLITGKNFRILNKKVLGQYNARIKEGYTDEDFKKAINNCKNNKHHLENPHFLTPEFITRSDKLEMYLNVKIKNKVIDWSKEHEF